MQLDEVNVASQYEKEFLMLLEVFEREEPCFFIQ